MRRRAAAAAVALVLVAALAVGVASSGGSEEGSPLEPQAAVAGGGAALAPGASGELGSGLGIGSMGGRRETSARDVASEAAAALAELRDQGDCVLVRAGYLDLSGRVWGCVVQGDGWSEVRVVRESGQGSEIVTWRLDAADVARALGQA